MQNKLFSVTYFCPALTSMMSAGPNLYSCPTTVTAEVPSYIDQTIHVHIWDMYGIKDFNVWVHIMCT